MQFSIDPGLFWFVFHTVTKLAVLLLLLLATYCAFRPFVARVGDSKTTFPIVRILVFTFAYIVFGMYCQYESTFRIVAPQQENKYLRQRDRDQEERLQKKIPVHTNEEVGIQERNKQRLIEAERQRQEAVKRFDALPEKK